MNDPFTSTPPGFGRTADGRLISTQPADSIGNNPNARRKFLLVLQYYSGDLERVDKLANLIADLERVHNSDVDIMLFGRKDCKPATLQYGTIENLKRKFETVHLADDAGNYETGFPWGANGMFADLVARMATPRWASKYRCFLNVEWDCTPTRPGWLGELGREFDAAVNEGVHVIGALQNDPMPHINGVAVYDTSINKLVKGGLDNGVGAEAAYDIAQREKVLPLARNTPLMMLQYRRSTISPDDLFALPACFLHGIRDESAIAAVRAEHIERIPRSQQTFQRSTVFTYRRKISGVDEREVDDQLAIWARGWQTCGFNPVVLDARASEHHPLFAEVMARVCSFPVSGNIEHANTKWERLLALAQHGGGLLSDFDVIPSTRLTANTLPERKGFKLLSDSGCLLLADKQGMADLIAAIMAYEPDAKATDVTIRDVLGDAPATADYCVLDRGQPGWREAKAVHFHAKALAASSPGLTPSRAMVSFLRNE